MTPDRIKEELQWLRTLFQVLAVVDIGLIAYVIQPTTPVHMVWLGGFWAAVAIGFLSPLRRLVRR